MVKGYKVTGIFGKRKFISPITYRTKTKASEILKKVIRYKTSSKSPDHYKKYKNLRVIKA